MSLSERINDVVDRYLTDQQSLESAAEEFAQLFYERLRAREATNYPVLEDSSSRDSRALTDEEYPRMVVLMDLVEARVDALRKGAT